MYIIIVKCCNISLNKLVYILLCLDLYLLQIIFRARRNHLMEKYISEDHSAEKISQDVEDSLKVKLSFKNDTDHDNTLMIGKVYTIIISKNKVYTK